MERRMQGCPALSLRAEIRISEFDFFDFSVPVDGQMKLVW